MQRHLVWAIANTFTLMDSEVWCTLSVVRAVLLGVHQTDGLSSGCRFVEVDRLFGLEVCDTGVCYYNIYMTLDD